MTSGHSVKRMHCDSFRYLLSVMDKKYNEILTSYANQFKVFLKNNNNWDSNYTLKSLGVAKKDVYDVIQMTNKYSRIKARSLFDDKSTPLATSFFKGLKGAENVYTQHQPFISKDLLPDIFRGRQRNDLNYLRQPESAPAKIIVYIIGGVTYEETRAIAMFNKDNGSNVVIGGTSILNYDSFMESMKNACISNDQ